MENENNLEVQQSAFMTPIQSDPKTSNFVSLNADLDSIFNVPLLSPTSSENQRKVQGADNKIQTEMEKVEEKNQRGK